MYQLVYYVYRIVTYFLGGHTTYGTSGFDALQVDRFYLSDEYCTVDTWGALFAMPCSVQGVHNLL